MVGAFSIAEIVERIVAAGFGKIRKSPMPKHVGTTILTAVRQ
jgi:hypothetical protein